MFLAAALLAAAAGARATSSLSFEGGGYWIDLEIGQTTVPSIAAVRFHRPGDPKGGLLLPGAIQIEVFDPQRRVMVIHYTGRTGIGAIQPFNLSVHDARAVLDVAGQRIVAPFDWGM